MTDKSVPDNYPYLIKKTDKGWVEDKRISWLEAMRIGLSITIYSTPPVIKAGDHD